MRRAAAATALALLVGGIVAVDRWVEATVLPPLTPETSAVVLDRRGTVISAYTVSDGRWRLPVGLAAVDRGYLEQLVAFEDRRFFEHPGVDPLALGRAALQSLVAGRIVSGGSTLTMQVARLIEEGPTGTLGGKIRQARVALALERRMGKEEILGLYLTLAPYGGNIEGVRAASLAWLGKEPRRLTPAEAALLVALPQSPETRRPDRAPEAARAARDRVLARMAAAGVLDKAETDAARGERVPVVRRPFPALAPHLADRLVAARPGVGTVETTLDAGLQARLEALVAERARGLGPGISAAVIVADHRSGEILARIGAADRLDMGRGGFVDMSRAVRSPGSALKPLVYGLAFEAGIAHPETVIEDRPMRFGGYAPQNLDRRYLGPISVRTALQASRNLPAVALLDAVGPAQLMARLRRAGVEPRLPAGGTPGLAMALGGVGVTLEELVRLYAAIAHGGGAVGLSEVPGVAGAEGGRVLEAGAAWQVGDVLRGTVPPSNGVAGRIAYKTGTSYGHRDAWAVGFDGAHVVGVWFGRPDGASVPGALGLEAAAPVLFDAFARIGAQTVPLPPAPPATLTVTAAELPLPLKHFRSRGVEIGGGPEIAFPPDGARVELAGGALAIRLGAGVPPFRWLVDGAPIAVDPFARQADWRPEGIGFVDLAVIDASGRAARASVFVE